MTQTPAVEVERTFGVLATPIHGAGDIEDKPTTWTGKSDMVWKDSSWLPFWDVEQECFGTLHVHTTLPGQRGKMMRVSLCHEGTYRQVLESPEAGQFSSPHVDYEPEKQGLFTVDHPDLQGELHFRPKWGIVDDWGRSAQFGGGRERPLNANIGAIEGHGRFTIAGREVEVNVQGVLDRNWGWRDESAQAREWFFVSAVFPSFALNYWRMRREDGSEVIDVVDGALTTDGGAIRLRDTPDAVRSIKRDPAALHLEHQFDLDDGRTMTLTATKPLGHFWVPMGWERIGPTCGTFDEFQRVRISDGNGVTEEGTALVEQGQLREIY